MTMFYCGSERARRSMFYYNSERVTHNNLLPCKKSNSTELRLSETSSLFCGGIWFRFRTFLKILVVFGLKKLGVEIVKSQEDHKSIFFLLFNYNCNCEGVFFKGKNRSYLLQSSENGKRKRYVGVWSIYEFAAGDGKQSEVFPNTINRFSE